MRRAAVIAAVVFLFFAVPGHHASAAGPGGGWRSHRGGIVSDVDALIRVVENRWHAGGYSRGERIADCESGDRPGVDSGQYSGVFQVGDTEWHTWRRPHHYRAWFGGTPGPHNARANVITALFHAHHVGWRAWSCA